MRYSAVLGIVLGTIALVTGPAQAAPKGCPPGLAKKNPPCVPPGLAKKRYPDPYPYRYRVGDYVADDYIVIRRPGRYGLDPNETYYRIGDHVFRVDRETREVLDFIGAAAALLD
ncbi:MAG: excinuclease ABC subunit A [Paracoccaceae bacterium]